MQRERVLQILKKTEALLTGHFLLTSGRHSNAYVQCAKVLRFPDYAEEILKFVSEQCKELEFDIIVGPAMGGVIVSYELGRQMKKEAVFTERVNGEMEFRRGFQIEEDAGVLIAEDVITTGKSTLEVKKAVEVLGGKVIGAACMVNRMASGSRLGIPVYSAIDLKIETYDPFNCPICQQGSIPLIKPGSRSFR